MRDPQGSERIPAAASRGTDPKSTEPTMTHMAPLVHRMYLAALERDACEAPRPGRPFKWKTAARGGAAVLPFLMILALAA
jgi:hypothetical protein